MDHSGAPIELAQNDVGLGWEEPDYEVFTPPGAPEPVYIDGTAPPLGPVLPDLAPLPTSPAPAASPPLMDAGSDYAWELKLPDFREQFTPARTCRTRVGVRGLLVDGHGVTGDFYAQNVISLQDSAKMDKWAFSVSDVRLELLASNVTEFGFGGQVQVPIAKEAELISYSADFDLVNDVYNFRISPDSMLAFPVLKMVDVEIHPASYIDVTVRQQQFEPELVLYATTEIKAKMGSTEPEGDDSDVPDAQATVKASQVQVQGLVLRTRGVKFDFLPGGHITFSQQPTLANFPVNILSASLGSSAPGVYTLGVLAELSLMGQQGNGLAIQGGFSIGGQLIDMGGGRDKLVFDHFTVNSLSVDIRFPGFALLGGVSFHDDDPVYGKGFQGALMVKVGDYARPTVEVQLNAMFGKVAGASGSDYNYWYVDGMVKGSAIMIPLVPGVLNINGFGGGAYYHMRLAGVTPPNKMNPPAGTGGVTTSGSTYVPDETISLGLKAVITLSSPPGASVLDGIATLEVMFNGTGLQNISFYGRLQVGVPAGMGGSGDMRSRLRTLTESQGQTRANDAASKSQKSNTIVCDLFLSMDFTGGFELKGSFSARLDVANGAITGGGHVDLFVSTRTNAWHLYVGGYDNRSVIGVNGSPVPPVQVNINLGSGLRASATAYFLTGTTIPPPPGIPADVARIVGVSPNTDTRITNMDARAATGSGFALGSHLTVDIDEGIPGLGSIKALVAVGFDISLLRYSEEGCSRTTSFNSPQGYRRWRATGNLYAAATVSGWVTIFPYGPFSIGVSLEGDLPNPAWVRASVGFQPLGSVSLPIGRRCGTPVQ